MSDASDIPGAPPWVREFFARIQEQQEILKEEVRHIVQTELATTTALMDTYVQQVRGYSTTIGESLARLDRFEVRLAQVEGLQSRDAFRPPAKTSPSAAPAAAARGPQLAKVASIAGKIDHPSTIPAPPGPTGAPGEDDSSA